MKDKDKRVIYWIALFVSSGISLISLIAFIAMIFGGEYTLWKWYEVIVNFVFFGLVAGYFYFKKIRNY